MSSVWFKALMATPPVIYGRRLRPFSLAHSITLRELKNPLIVGGPVSLDDVYVALEVCSRTRNEIRRDLFNVLSAKARVKWRLRWFRMLKKADVAVESLRQYMSDFSDGPVHAVPEKKPEGYRLLSAPSEYHRHRRLCEYGYDPEAAWEVSCSMAACLYDVLQELDGDTTLLPQWKVENDERLVRSNALRDEGKTQEADELLAEVKRIIEEHK